jgi:hypothetical protein
MRKLRAILLTTSLLVALPAAGQEQYKSIKSGAAARASAAIGATQPMVIDVSKKPIRLAQKDEAPKTQESTEGRTIPGRLRNFEKPVLQNNLGAVTAPPPEAFPTDWVPVPDRWRIVDALGVGGQWWDPYNQNVIKGDRPILGTHDWFLDLTGISDSVAELRSFPTPVSIQTSQRPGSLDVFGQADSAVFVQTFIVGADTWA